MKVGMARIADRFRLRRRNRQKLLPFQNRLQRRNRFFRGSIVALTVLAHRGDLGGMAIGACEVG